MRCMTPAVSPPSYAVIALLAKGDVPFGNPSPIQEVVWLDLSHGTMI
ncbi:hypothetical protein LEP3755_35890 [Leptolyngbya sp. NIES-3755]|nr:hypothetical protein LEP3755_35890 [Leptolyngbya sp. NIES-3755]